MTRRASFRQADVTKLIRGAIAGGMPVGSFKVVAEEGRLTLSPVASREGADDAADMARRMREAFGEPEIVPPRRLSGGAGAPSVTQRVAAAKAAALSSARRKPPPSR